MVPTATEFSPVSSQSSIVQTFIVPDRKSDGEKVRDSGADRAQPATRRCRSRTRSDTRGCRSRTPPTPSQDRLQRLFWISGPRKPPDWIGPTILAFYWRLRWPAGGVGKYSTYCLHVLSFPAEVDVGPSAHDTYPTGEMPLSPLPV